MRIFGLLCGCKIFSSKLVSSKLVSSSLYWQQGLGDGFKMWRVVLEFIWRKLINCLRRKPSNIFSFLAFRFVLRQIHPLSQLVHVCCEDQIDDYDYLIRIFLNLLVILIIKLNLYNFPLVVIDFLLWHFWLTSFGW